MSVAWGSPEGDELDVLATLVVDYEAQHFPIAPPDPITAIEFRMEQQGLSRKDLEPMIGSRARVSEVMTGKRPLTLEMIRRLSAELGISADVLIEAFSVPAKSGDTHTTDIAKKSGKQKTRVVAQQAGRARKPAAGMHGVAARTAAVLAAKSSRKSTNIHPRVQSY